MENIELNGRMYNMQRDERSNHRVKKQYDERRRIEQLRNEPELIALTEEIRRLKNASRNDKSSLGASLQ